MLADIYGGLGLLYAEINRPQDTLENLQAALECVHKALNKSELRRPSMWEVDALQRVGNSLQRLRKYEEAESYYRSSLQAWGDLPGEKKMYMAHFASCLLQQGKLDEAEETLRPLITDRSDTTRHM